MSRNLQLEGMNRIWETLEANRKSPLKEWRLEIVWEQKEIEKALHLSCIEVQKELANDEVEGRKRTPKI